MDAQCWTTKHLQHALFIALPGLVLWGIASPAIVLGMIVKKRKQLMMVETRSKFGFLYIGYKNDAFYWEFIILYRKITIVGIGVFFSVISTQIQALSVLVVLIASAITHARKNPFEDKSLNNVELASILVQGITIYCGLFYLTEKLDEVSAIIFFLVIAASNIYFLLYWLIGVIVTFGKKIATNKPSQVVRFFKNAKKIRNVAVEKLGDDVFPQDHSNGISIFNELKIESYHQKKQHKDWNGIIYHFFEFHRDLYESQLMGDDEKPKEVDVEFQKEFEHQNQIEKDIYGEIEEEDEVQYSIQASSVNIYAEGQEE